MATGWAYVGCSTTSAGAQGPSGSIQFHTGSTGLSGSAAFMITNAGPLEPYGARVHLSGTLNVEGTISASHLHIESITEIDATGSTYFGDTGNDLHARTGSFGVSWANGAGTSAASLFWVTGSAASSSLVGIGTTAPSGALHVQTNELKPAGSVISSADDVLICNDDAAGMSFLIPDTKNGTLNWASPSSTSYAQVRANYGSGTPYMQIMTFDADAYIVMYSGNGTEALRLGANQSLTASQTISASAGLTGSALVVEHEVYTKTLSASFGISGSTLNINNTAQAGRFAGGSGAAANGLYTSVLAGTTNTATGQSSAVLAGAGNNTEAAGQTSAIGAGTSNRTAAGDSFIGAGNSNYNAGQYGAIGGGHSNVILGSYTAIGAGQNCTASSFHAFIGAGYNNVVSGHRSAILGGQDNTVSAPDAIILGSTGSLVASRGSFAIGTNLRVEDDNTIVLGGSSDDKPYLIGISGNLDVIKSAMIEGNITAGGQLSASAGLSGSSLAVEHDAVARTLSASFGISGSTLNINNYAYVGNVSSSYGISGSTLDIEHYIVAGNLEVEDDVVAGDVSASMGISGSTLNIDNYVSASSLWTDDGVVGNADGSLYFIAGNNDANINANLNMDWGGTQRMIAWNSQAQWIKAEIGGAGGDVNDLTLKPGNTGQVTVSGSLSASYNVSASNYYGQKLTLLSGSTMGSRGNLLHQFTGSMAVSSSLTGSQGYGAPVLFVTSSGRVGIGLPTYNTSLSVPTEPSASLHISGSLAVHYFKIVGSSYTAAPKDYILGISSSGAVTLTLPGAAAAGAGRLLVVKDEYYQGGASRAAEAAITATCSLGTDNLIDGQEDYDLYGSNQGSYTLYSDGVNKWFVV